MKDYIQITLFGLTGFVMLTIVASSFALTDALALNAFGYRLHGLSGLLTKAAALLVVWLPLAFAAWVIFILVWRALFYRPKVSDQPSPPVDASVPGLPAIATAVLTLAAVAASFVILVYIPLLEYLAHASNWPAGVSLTEFSVIVGSPDPREGDIRVGIRNDSKHTIRGAGFSVLVGFYREESLTRLTFTNVAPGMTRTVSVKSALGDIRPRKVGRIGQGHANARLEWDWIELDGASSTPSDRRPAAATFTIEPAPKPATATPRAVSSPAGFDTRY